MRNGGEAPRVCIVVPNWNSFEHLPTCLDALADQTFRDFETVVVDNGSTDSSLEWLRDRSDVRVVELGSNRGFSAACNAGIAAGTSEYVVMLNNDTRADRDWLGRLVAAMDRSRDFGWAASKLVRFDDPELIDSAGHAYSVWIGAARNLGEGAPAKRFDQARRVFGAAAAASIYRRSMLADIGGFDDEFFLIHEDTDLDLRANAAGYRCLFVPDAIVAHKRGSSYEVSPRIHLMGVRNRIWTTRSLPPGLLALWMLTKVLRAFRWIPARLTARKTSSRTDPSAWHDVPPIDVVRATLAALWTLPRKRSEVRSTRRLSSVQLWRVLSETGLRSHRGHPEPRADASSNQY